MKKLLVANRGEIACRVFKTCQRIKLPSVAIYSEADVNSLHVKLANEAYCVGPPQTAKSYLNQTAILDALLKSKADGVHPGYGFLSENADFCQMLEENKITFVGPNSKAIQSMGDKIQSKLLAKRAGVRVIPGFDGEIKTVEEAIDIAKTQIGYPVMIKCSAGGGGKGMRIAYNDAECQDAFQLSKQEGKSSFGDDRLLIEKYIDEPRHVEIQVLCDKFGNGVYLNERECSIQRRNQKVIEEAPSPAITPVLRAEMGRQALLLCKEVSYDSAGTVEFLVDKDNNFYFLEMNTRLQVEHPITEYITGTDLVHEMIKVASGERLSMVQSDVKINGWAIESRVYAEDPTLMLPSIGRLNHYIEPKSVSGCDFDRYDCTHLPMLQNNVRVDSGIENGDEISIYYDPMISKLITYGETRDEAIAHMERALDTYYIRGVTHNIPLLRDLIGLEKFKSGAMTTKLIQETYQGGFKGTRLTKKEENSLACMSALMHLIKFEKDHHASSGGRPVAFPDELVVELPQIGEASDRVLAPKHLKSVVLSQSVCEKTKLSFFCMSGEVFDGHETSQQDDNAGSKQGHRMRIEVPAHQIGERIQQVTAIDNRGERTEYILQVSDVGVSETSLGYKGNEYKFGIYLPHVHALKQHMPVHASDDSANHVATPMPGAIVSIAVKEGAEVNVGEELVVVEAMKMQNSLKATKRGVVKKIYFKPGDSVSASDVLIDLE